MKKWIPDYANMDATNLWGSGSTATITETGFVRVWGNFYKVNENCEAFVKINDSIAISEATEARGPNNAVVCNVSGVLPVSAGDVVTVTSTSGAGVNRRICQFIPGRWV